MGPDVLSLGNITVFVIEGERKTKRDVLGEKNAIFSLFTFFFNLINIILTVFYDLLEALSVDEILHIYYNICVLNI